MLDASDETAEVRFESFSATVESAYESRVNEIGFVSCDATLWEDDSDDGTEGEGGCRWVDKEDVDKEDATDEDEDAADADADAADGDEGDDCVFSPVAGSLLMMK